MERYNVKRNYAKLFFRFLTNGVDAFVFKDIHEINLQDVITQIVDNLTEDELMGSIDDLIEIVEYSINDYITFVNYEPDHCVTLFYDGPTSLVVINGKCYIEEGFFYDNERQVIEDWVGEYYAENRGQPTRVIIFFVDVFRRNVPIKLLCEGL